MIVAIGLPKQQQAFVHYFPCVLFTTDKTGRIYFCNERTWSEK